MCVKFVGEGLLPASIYSSESLIYRKINQDDKLLLEKIGMHQGYSSCK